MGFADFIGICTKSHFQTEKRLFFQLYEIHKQTHIPLEPIMKLLIDIDALTRIKLYFKKSEKSFGIC